MAQAVFDPIIHDILQNIEKQLEKKISDGQEKLPYKETETIYNDVIKNPKQDMQREIDLGPIIWKS